MQKSLKLIGAVLLCQIIGGLGAVFTTPAIGGWYAGLVKPIFNPPNWLFGPVWTLLYAMMAVAWWLVGFKEKKIFLTQLGVNLLWSIVFFGLKQPGVAVGVIVVLWVLIFLTIRKFMSINKLGGWLLYPYLLWVSFATILNVAITILN